MLTPEALAVGVVRRARRIRLIAMMLALAVVLAAAVAASGRQAAPAGSYADSQASDLFISPTGDDTGSCTAAAPCLSLQRAFDVAKPGQRVALAQGTYAGQDLSGSKGAGPAVVFAPAPGARVVFSGRLTLESLTHVMIGGITFQTADPYFDLVVDSCNDDVTLEGFSGRMFLILEGNQAIRFHGGSWGGYSTPGLQDSSIGTSGPTGPTRICNGALAGPARNIVFDGVAFHDVFYGVPSSAWGDSHPDCFQINGYVDGVRIVNSKFARCANSFIMAGSTQGDIRNFVIENSTFRDLGSDSYYGIQIVTHGSGTCDGFVFRRNSYFPNTPTGLGPDGPIRTECTLPSGGTAGLVTQNLFRRAPTPFNCDKYLRPPTSARWDDNMFGQGACGTRPTGAPFGYQLAGSALSLVRAQAASVRRVFAEAAKGTPMAKIARSLKQKRFAAPPGGWKVPTVKQILSTQAYLGGLYGARDAHPAIITRKAWAAARRASR